MVKRKAKTVYPSLAEIFSAKVAEAGLSYAEIATVTGLSEDSIYSYCSGRRKPNLVSAVRLAHKFGMSIDELANTLEVMGSI